MPDQTPPDSPRPSRRAELARLCLLLAAIAGVAVHQRPDGRLHLFFPAVPGDAILIQTPRGDYVLLDGGADPAALAVALGRRMPFWRRDLAAVVLTAPDTRRAAGQVAALQRYRVGRALVAPGALRGGGAMLREWRRLLGSQRVPVRAARPGDRVDLGGATLRVLDTGQGDGLLLRIEYGGTAAVLAHAADPGDEARLAQAAPARRTQLLVFPWDRDPRTPLAERLRPRAIVFSDGSPSDHPARLTYVERSVAGATLYHEQNDGAIEWVSDGRRAWVLTEVHD